MWKNDVCAKKGHTTKKQQKKGGENVCRTDWAFKRKKFPTEKNWKNKNCARESLGERRQRSKRKKGGGKA